MTEQEQHIVRYVCATREIVRIFDPDLANDPQAVAAWTMAALFGMEETIGDVWWEVVSLSEQVIEQAKAVT